MASNYSTSYNDRLADETNHRWRTAHAEAHARTPYLTPAERILRLSSRYMMHRAAGRVQAAQAVKRMAQRIIDGR